MTVHEARKISKEHKFTKKELYDILKQALAEVPKEFWPKPNKVNALFNNGYYFNQCKNWIDYKPGENDDTICHAIVAFRILEVFGDFSKIQPPKKSKRKLPEMVISEIPTLD